MKKEEILNSLLKSLLDGSITKLEKKSTEEIKDLKVMKLFFNRQESLIKSYLEDIKKRTMLRQKTSDDLKSSRRTSRLFTPSNNRSRISKSKDKFISKEKNNFSNLNRLKIDGNYKPKNDPSKKINKLQIIKNKDTTTNERKNYKTPIRKIHSQINSISKIKKVKKNHQNKNNKDNPIVSNRNIKKNKIELNDSINRANKSFIINNKNNLNKSNSNINNYSNKKNKKSNSSQKKPIKINMINKDKKNLFMEKLDIDKKQSNVIVYDKNNFGDWLCTDDGRDVLISISNYLDSKSKYNLFSCKKSYLKFLYRYIDDKYTEFKEKNKINPHSNSIQEEIEQIKSTIPEDELNKINTKFNLSISTTKVFELLNKEEHLNFFDINKYDSFSDDIYLVYKIIFQLSKNNEVKSSENKKDFFEKMVKYVKENIKDNKVGNLFKEMVNDFDFSKDNIIQIKNIIKGNEDKLKPKYYSKICATTGLVIFLVKDILEYLGLNENNKSNAATILANLEFIEKMKSKIPNYLKFLQNQSPIPNPQSPNIISIIK